MDPHTPGPLTNLPEHRAFWHTVHRRSSLCTHVPHCSLLFPTVQECSTVSKGVINCGRCSTVCADVPQCVQVFPTVQGCSSILGGCSILYPCTLGNTPTHWGIPLSLGNTPTHRGTPLHTGARPCTLGNICTHCGTPRTANNTFAHCGISPQSGEQ